MVGVVGVIILCLLRQWVSAAIFFGICVVVSIGVLLFTYVPALAVFLTLSLAGLAAAVYVIVLFVKQEFITASILLGVCVGLFFFGLFYGFEKASAAADFFSRASGEDLAIGFAFLLMVIVGLLGVEWLTRKLLRFPGVRRVSKASRRGSDSCHLMMARRSAIAEDSSIDLREGSDGDVLRKSSTTRTPSGACSIRCGSCAKYIRQRMSFSKASQLTHPGHDRACSGWAWRSTSACSCSTSTPKPCGSSGAS